MSDCPRCANLEEVIASVSASEHEARDQVAALNRALALAENREQAAKGKLTRQQTQAAEAKVIYACLDVWHEHCWAGKGKPSTDITGARAGRVREFLALENIGPDDICDGFRGLGLLPYEGPYGMRSAVLKPGFKRKADVQVVLRTVRTAGTAKACPDEARLERFRDYYRRVQATPAERLLEQWEQASAVANELFVLVMRAQGKELAQQSNDEAQQAGHLFVIEGGKAA